MLSECDVLQDIVRYGALADTIICAVDLKFAVCSAYAGMKKCGVQDDSIVFIVYKDIDLYTV